MGGHWYVVVVVLTIYALTDVATEHTGLEALAVLLEAAALLAVATLVVARGAVGPDLEGVRVDLRPEGSGVAFKDLFDCFSPHCLVDAVVAARHAVAALAVHAAGEALAVAGVATSG